MAQLRFVVLVLAFEVLLTCIIGAGIYLGFSIFPFSSVGSISGAGSGNPGETTTSFYAVIPMYMPGLSDLKIPYTLLDSGKQAWGVLGFIGSILILVLQAFVRGMYLGGIKGWVLKSRILPLLPSGRFYFRRMLAWSVFQHGTGAILVFLGSIFFPIALILSLIMLLYALTPYLIVLQNISFAEALASSPRLFRRYFRKMLPLALLAMFCSLLISLTQQWPQYVGYAFPLIAFAVVGTMLIVAFVAKLSSLLQADSMQLSEVPAGHAHTSRAAFALWIVLVPILVTVGVFGASGKLLSVLDFSKKTELSGLSFSSGFSSPFYASDQNYTSYSWQNDPYTINMHLPNLAGGKQPSELRGIAEITWRVDQEVRTTSGHSTSIYSQPFTKTSKIMYRLQREVTQEGAVYYSSMNGSASILSGTEESREPLKVHLMISADGKDVFVIQYPARFDIGYVFRASENGQYLIPKTNPVNPMDFYTYWFSSNHNVDDIFQMLVEKNKTNHMSRVDRAHIVLAAAMQEGDGRMVAEMIEVLRQREDIAVDAPDWDGSTWTKYLREQYDGLSLEDTLQYLSNAGVQDAYQEREITEHSPNHEIESDTGKILRYQLDVPLPQKSIQILFEQLAENGMPISISVKIQP